MDATTGNEPRYVLGNDAPELARLDFQANLIDAPTRLLLREAGLRPGMRILDLGTGLGHVARIIRSFVGETGSVVGIDQSAEALAVAQQRATKEEEGNVSFVRGDVATWAAEDKFDAIVGRLILFHAPDPLRVVRHHLGNLRPGGLFIGIDFDLAAARTEPRVALVAELVSWVAQAFSLAGATPSIGARLGTILEQAGLNDVRTFGIQAYLPPHNRSGAAFLAGIVRSLAGEITRRRIATSEQIDVGTLEARIADALTQTKAVLLPPTVAGAWGRLSTAN
jgi:ubiquinone/menaquinone biosynthesis C-methylase UbiE